MKKRLLLCVVGLVMMLSTASYAKLGLHLGVRGGEMNAGLENQPLSSTNWLVGYGVDILMRSNSFMVYGGIQKIISQSPWLYLSVGPTLGIGSRADFGMYGKLGIMSIFGVSKLNGEVGLDLGQNNSGAFLQLSVRI